jgi:hypothetical protein
LGNATGVTFPGPEKAVSVTAPIVVGGILGFAWPLLGSLLVWPQKMIGLVYDGIKSYLQKLFSVKEEQYRKVKPKPRKKWLFGISITEFFVGIACALLIGITFSYARESLSSLSGLLVVTVAAALTIVVSELVRRYFAARYSVETEYQFWDAGAVILVVTAILRQPFSRPARTIVNRQGSPGAKKLGIIAMAPCVASLALSIVFLLLTAAGSGFETLGKEGFKMGMMICIYSLMPFEPMDGKRVIWWSKMAWGALFIPALAIYLGVLLFMV